MGLIDVGASFHRIGGNPLAPAPQGCTDGAYDQNGNWIPGPGCYPDQQQQNYNQQPNYAPNQRQQYYAPSQPQQYNR